jgi:hypothetical protein
MRSVRFALALLVLAACAADTPEDRLQHLIDDNKVVCHTYNPLRSDADCRARTPEIAADAASCMTLALSVGTRAAIFDNEYDSQLFGYTTYIFAVDGEVDVFDYYPGPYRYGDGPKVTREQTCTGPVRGTESFCGTVVVDGCTTVP